MEEFMKKQIIILSLMASCLIATSSFAAATPSTPAKPLPPELNSPTLAFLQELGLDSQKINELVKNSTDNVTLEFLHPAPSDIGCKFSLQITRDQISGLRVDDILYEKGGVNEPWENSYSATLQEPTGTARWSRKTGSGDVDLVEGKTAWGQVSYVRLYVQSSEYAFTNRISLRKNENLDDHEISYQMQIVDFVNDARGTSSKWCRVDNIEIYAGAKQLNTQDFLPKPIGKSNNLKGK
jgi:hypothetical protein